MFMKKINFEDICKLIPNWKWCELSFALNKSFISHRDIISYASFILSADMEQFDKIIELSIAENNEVEEILCGLIENEEKREIDGIKSKWMFAIIYNAYINAQDNVYDVIDDVYSEFEYPEEISNLIAYMPRDDGRTIDEKLMEYVDEEKRKWC